MLPSGGSGLTVSSRSVGLHWVVDSRLSLGAANRTFGSAPILVGQGPSLHAPERTFGGGEAIAMASEVLDARTTPRAYPAVKSLILLPRRRGAPRRWGQARPTLESAGEGARIRIFERGSDLEERQLRIL